MRRLMAMAAAAACIAAGADAETGFSLDLSFDDAAAAELERRGERVIVSVFYFGEPNAAGAPHADEMNQIYLGAEQITVRGLAQTVRIGANVDAKALAEWVAGGAARANVNVYSARFTDENNILNCGIFEDAVTVAQAAAPRIDCTLLGL